MDSMSVETMHDWNAPLQMFLPARNVLILGILSLDFQRLSAFFSLNTSRVGNETDLLTQWLVLRQSFAMVDKILNHLACTSRHRRPGRERAGGAARLGADLRVYACLSRHLRPQDPKGTVGCERAGGAA
jgi:hypothetical protein